VIGVVAEEGEDWRSVVVAETAQPAQSVPGRTRIVILSLTFDSVSIIPSLSHFDKKPPVRFRNSLNPDLDSGILLNQDPDPACC
jgi:hypothetical protein